MVTERGRDTVRAGIARLRKENEELRQLVESRGDALERLARINRAGEETLGRLGAELDTARLTIVEQRNALDAANAANQRRVEAEDKLSDMKLETVRIRLALDKATERRDEAQRDAQRTTRAVVTLAILLSETREVAP